MEMTGRGDAPCTNGFQVSDLPKRKKKKRKLEELDVETGRPSVDAPLHSPFPSDCSSLASWQVEGQETEDDNAAARKKKKKKKKKDSKEIPDSRDESSWIVPESELKSEDGVDLTHKKNKKKKYKPCVHDGDVEEYVPEVPEAASTLAEETDVEGVHQDDESPPLRRKKKKKKKAKEPLVEEADSSETSGLPPSEKTLSAEWQNPNQTDPSDAEGSLELFSSFPPLHQDPPVEGENEVAGSDPPDEPNSPGEQKKARRRKKARRKASHRDGSHATEDGLGVEETVELAPEDNQALDRLSPKPLDQDPPVEGENEVAGLNPPDEPNSPGEQKKACRRKKARRKASHRDGSHATEDGLEVEETVELAPEDNQALDRLSPKPLDQDPPVEGENEVAGLNPPDEPNSPGEQKKARRRKKARRKASRRDGSHATEDGLGVEETVELAPEDNQALDRLSPKPLDQDPPVEGENEVAGLNPPDEPNSPGEQKKARRRKKARRKASHRDGSHATEDGLGVEEGVVLAPEDNQAPDRLQKTLPLAHTDAEEPSSPERPASETSSLFDDDFLESFSTQAIDLESVTKELEEFIPHVRSLCDSAIMQLASRDLDRFKKFKEKGIAVRFGKFSKKEDKLLKRNIEAFLDESGIDTAEKLLFTHRFPEEKSDINKLKTKHLFGVRIAEGIPRPWRLVYYRGRRLFDPQNHKGKFSEKEKKQLKKYQAMYGNNWTKISEIMCRSSKSVEQKFSNIRSDPKFGHWSEEETEKLIQSVAEVLKSKAKSADSSQDQKNGSKTLLLDREMIYKNIPWSQIEKEVGTRNWKQCRKKWNAIVAKRIAGGQTTRTQSENTWFRIKLIRRLNKLNVEEEYEINWEDISSAMGNLPPNYLQSRYYKMKTAYVPFWNRRSFSEIIYYLHKKKLPQLKALVKQKAAVQKAAATAKASWDKEAFPFSYIFPDCSPDLPVDDEEED